DGQRAEGTGVDVGARIEERLDDREGAGRRHGGADVGGAGRLRRGAGEVDGDRVCGDDDLRAHRERLETVGAGLQVRLVDVLALAKPADGAAHPGLGAVHQLGDGGAAGRRTVA